MVLIGRNGSDFDFDESGNLAPNDDGDDEHLALERFHEFLSNQRRRRAWRRFLLISTGIALLSLWAAFSFKEVLH